MHNVDIIPFQASGQFFPNFPPRAQDWEGSTICMTRHHFSIPSIGSVGSEELDYRSHPTPSLRGPDVKHRTHRFPLGRHTTHLLNEGLADAVLYGVLIFGPVKGPIGEAHD